MDDDKAPNTKQSIRKTFRFIFFIGLKIVSSEVQLEIYVTTVLKNYPSQSVAESCKVWIIGTQGRLYLENPFLAIIGTLFLLFF